MVVGGAASGEALCLLPQTGLGYDLKMRKRRRWGGERRGGSDGRERESDPMEGLEPETNITDSGR